jgi:hypothetical protein
VCTATPASAATSDVTTYLADNAHSAFYSAETQLSPATASTLAPTWQATSHGSTFVSSQPIVVNGLVYWGDLAGYEHATNVATGQQVWESAPLGSYPGSAQCPGYALGISAAVVAGQVNGTAAVFVAGGTDHFFALNALTGATIWDITLGAEPNQELFAAATLYNGSLYLPLSSNGDCPALTQGLIFKIDPATGAVQGTFKVVPDGCVGGGIWSALAIDAVDDAIYFTSGNPGACSTAEPLAQAVVKIKASTLALVDSWQPSISLTDSDFGATPTLFTGMRNGQVRPLVGAVNKNGTYYAFDRSSLSAGPIWTYAAADPGAAPDLGTGAIAPAAWDGTHLYVAGEKQGTCAGTISALDPSSGSPTWRNCLDGPVIGGMAAAPGIVAVGAGATLRVFGSGTGTQLFQYGDGSTLWYWAAPTISNGMLLIPKETGVLHALSSTLFNGPPSVIADSPAAGSFGVSLSPTINVTFNEAVNPAGLSFSLKSQDGSSVPGVSAYQPGPASAIFTPNAPLAYSTTYTAMVSGATDSKGVAMTPASWSFTTMQAPGCPCLFVQQAANHAGSVASLSVTPAANVVAGDRMVVEVGAWSAGGARANGVTDSAGNTYIKVTSLVASDNTEMSLWTAPITKGGGTRLTITATPTRTTDLGLTALEYTGLSVAPDLTAIDRSAIASGATGIASKVSSGATAATTTGGEEAIGFYLDSGFGDVLSAGSGFTQRGNVSPTGDIEMLAEDLLVGAGATPNATAGTGGLTTWLMATVVFKPGSTTPTVPAAPTGVTATAGNTQASVSWTAPSSNGGSVITSYTVTPYIGNTAQPASTVSGSPTTVSGLTNNLTYTFTVSATNSVGTGAPSAPSNGVTPTAPTVPGAPTGVLATAGDAQASVSWTAPSSNGGSPITSYTVTPYIGTTAQPPSTVSGSPMTVLGLTNNSTYTFTVSATNAVGTGAASSPSNAVTPTVSTASAAFVQAASTHASGSSVAVATASAVAANDRLIVEVGVWNSISATTSSVTDSAGNLYTELTHFAAADQTEMSVWSAPITKGGGTKLTVTAKPTSAADVGLAVLEYSGLSTATGVGAIDQQSHATGATAGTSATVASGSTAATGAGGELAVGFYVDSGFGDTLTNGSGWAQRVNVSPTGDMEFVVEDQVVAQGATPNAAVGTGPNTSWLVATIVFKHA